MAARRSPRPLPARRRRADSHQPFSRQPSRHGQRTVSAHDDAGAADLLLCHGPVWFAHDRGGHAQRRGGAPPLRQSSSGSRFDLRLSHGQPGGLPSRLCYRAATGPATPPNPHGHGQCGRDEGAGQCQQTVLGWIFVRLIERVQHVPTSIILQFVTTFGVWIVAERVGLSGVLTMVCYAIVLAQTLPQRTPARIRISAYAVWETVVFVMNILAFIFIGLQLRPILASLGAAIRGRYLAVAVAVLLMVIVVRVAWHMSFNAVVRWRQRRRGFHPPRSMMRPTVGSGLIVSWSAMRGILSLAAAMALPSSFPYRDLIVLTAFVVVFGTLALQGLTLKPLIRALKLCDDDPIGHELSAARARALSAALAHFKDDRSPAAIGHP